MWAEHFFPHGRFFDFKATEKSVTSLARLRSISIMIYTGHDISIICVNISTRMNKPLLRNILFILYNMLINHY